jgi:proline dehydrogenase/CBS domain-containing protein
MFVVGKWMTENVITVLPHDKIIDAFELMQGRGIRHLPVVENGELKGLVTDRDIRLALIPSLLSTPEERMFHLGALEQVDEIMTTDLITVAPTTTIEEAAKLMAKYKIGAVPVVADGQLVGILTETDILCVFIEMLETIQASSRLDVVLGDKPGALDEIHRLLEASQTKVISVSMSPKGTAGSPVYSFRIQRGPVEPLVLMLESAGYRVVQAEDGAAGVRMAMKMLGEQFVTGQTIGEALKNGRALEAKGFSYSYDMLGEAATTANDAERYMAQYVGAIHAIGKAAKGKGIYQGPGISIKLSALHPRYARAKYQRVMGELLPRLKELAALAKGYTIGLNIDAEEADRLELSLDLLEALALDPEFDGWDGIGFVVQAYSKRCTFVIDWIIDLARRSGHRIMVRLVKGAYWDSEIKRAQIEGLDGFPVYTRKVYSDVSYIACAKKLLAAPDAVFPQFATHNAQTMATIYEIAGPDFTIGTYEFQCLHGMGEPLYEQVVGKDKLDRPCRIYAPVGSHETLLAYLVRRLLENGANSSFVNQIVNKDIAAESIAAMGVVCKPPSTVTFLFCRNPRVNSGDMEFSMSTSPAFSAVIWLMGSFSILKVTLSR